MKLKVTVVLIVEDEFLLRINAAEMLADAGSEVVEACSADEAIAILEVRRDIHVVFTNIQMLGSMDVLKLPASSEDVGRPPRSLRHSAISGRRRTTCRKVA